jgi:signal transduction histidine kinase
VGRQLSSALDSLQLIEEVGRSRAELQSAFDALPSLVAVTDRRGRIAHVNSAFASRLNVKPSRLRGRLLAECIGPELADWLEELAHRPVSTEPGTREVTDPGLGGPLAVTIIERVDPSGQAAGVILVARDLAVRPGMASPPDAQAQKLAALGQFVAGLAHELNNPLQGVLGHLDLLRATHALPKTLRPSMRTIYCEADRAAKIVRSLLMFAGSRRTARRRVSLSAVLKKVVALRQRSCRERGIEILRNPAERLPRVLGDALLLHQVFLNMLLNAEQAIADTGRPGRIELASMAVDGQVFVRMRDTGPGIPPDALQRVFEPFYTTKDVGQGTGLGLAIAYGIVQDHGGRIVAANDPDGGAVLTVALPAAPPRPAE